MRERCVWLGSVTDGMHSRVGPGLMVTLVPRWRHYWGRVGFDVTGVINATTGNQFVDEIREFPQGLVTLFQRIARNFAACKESCTKEICCDFL